MPCAGFSPELYDLYAIGILERGEAADIDDHLSGNCATCEDEIHRSLERTALFALATPLVAPPRGLRDRIIRSVQPERPRRWAWIQSPALAWGMAAAFLVLGGSSVWYLASHAITQRNPMVVSRVTPTPVIVAPPSPAAVPPATVPSTPVPSAGGASRISEVSRSLAQVQAQASVLNQNVTQQRTRIAQLETELRTKDQLLGSAQRQVSTLQARDNASPSVPAAAGTASQDVQRQLASSQRQVEDLTRQVRFYQTALQSQRGQLNRNIQLISLLSSPTLRVLDLQGTEQGRGASGRALLANNSQVIFYASKLPTLPAGRTYQLWLMRDRGRAVSSGGIFQPDQNQRAVLTVQGATGVNAITALAVTDEPAGGQPLPTGHKILFGTAKT